MGKRVTLWVLWVCLMTPIVGAESVGELTGVFRPDMISIGNNRIYISEKTTIHIFDFKGLKPVKRFGKEGEGPREFKINPFGAPLIVVPHNNRLVVNSMAKVSIFTAEGEFIKEFKIPPSQAYFPFGDGYVFTGNAPLKEDNTRTVIAVGLADKNLQKTGELYQSDFEVGNNMRFDFPMNSFAFDNHNGRVYVVAGKEGFAVDVFDGTGKKLHRIQKKYTPLPVPGEYQTRTRNWFKTNSSWKNMYDFFKDRFSFKSHYPAIFNFNVGNDRIYLLTHRMRKDNTERECQVLDLEGKQLKQVFLPVPEVYGFDYLPKYTFHDGWFYYLTENQEEETIELHKIKL